jgi:hypothetical protein
MASAGQTATQAPQSVHFSASMMKIGSPSLIASLGHSGMQVPQAKQASVILWAICISFEVYEMQ